VRQQDQICANPRSCGGHPFWLAPRFGGGALTFVTWHFVSHCPLHCLLGGKTNYRSRQLFWTRFKWNHVRTLSEEKQRRRVAQRRFGI
jgi:hypothetical protein